jgi:hypothetical protein
LDGLGQAVHFINAPGNTDDRPQRALACGHFGELRIGIDDPLRVRSTFSSRSLSRPIGMRDRRFR